MAFDEDGETDAAERYAELTGAVIEDLEEDDDEDEEVIADDLHPRGDDEIDTDDTGDGDVGDVVHVDDADIDDVAALDAEIEDEDDLFDDEFSANRPVAGDAPDNGSSDEEDSSENVSSKIGSSGNETVDAERKVEEKPGKVERAVGPAFIEPDFGDILSDAPDVDSDGDDDLDENQDGGEQGRDRQGKSEKK
ncbi:hypothetical protein AB0G15_08665 [Streptosporangium sp. NPDC023825]|uniref:hypothetical protein n=1 Tax=Streptosporangium sp. NPDC023825 TaxID=3154909 RepID=UPI0034147BB7